MGGFQAAVSCECGTLASGHVAYKAPHNKDVYVAHVPDWVQEERFPDWDDGATTIREKFGRMGARRGGCTAEPLVDVHGGAVMVNVTFRGTGVCLP